MKGLQNINFPLFSLLIPSIIFLGCRSDGNKVIDNYPIEVINLGAETKYDEAKLAIYEFYSQCTTDLFVKTKKGTIDTVQTNVSFLTLPLKMTYVESRQDTLMFYFFFLEEGKFFLKTDPKCQSLNGIGFVGQKDSIGFYDFGDNYIRLDRKEFSMEFDTFEIYQNFRQILKTEKKNLDPWLLREAKKRGML